MDEAKVMHYFLGANSEKGFYSLYSGLTAPEDGEFLWVIKGGPGCGKSSFMHTLGKAAEENGLDVEYVHCSGDPHSLDAVRIPALKTAYVDGTSPHIIEAVYPGCSSLYLDLGTFYDACALENDLEKIINLNHDYKALYRRAYSYLSAAGSISPEVIYSLSTPRAQNKIQKRVTGLAAREMKALDKRGKTRNIFLDAISCEGTVSYMSEMSSLYNRVCILDNEYGLASVYLNEIYAVGISRGYDAVVCRDPLCPSKIKAVFFPELSLGFTSLAKNEKPPENAYRHIRLDALVEKDIPATTRREFKECRKLQNTLISRAITVLAQAKALHDKLESIYNPHVDFEGLYRVAEDHKAWLLGK